MISIVTLHLRREEHTRRFVEHLYQHTPNPFELIVVSQDSRPATIAFLEELRAGRRNLRILWNDGNVGTAAGRNQGIRAACGDRVVVADNDIEPRAGWLTPLVESLESDPQVAGVGGLVLTPQGRPQYCAPYMVERSDHAGRRSIGLHFDRWFRVDSPEIGATCTVPWYPTTCLLLRRSAFERAGGFDEAFRLAEEDKDLCLSLRRVGGRLVCNPSSQVVHHNSPRDPEYAKIREDLALLRQDRKRFEEKWGYGVIHESSRRYLLEGGIPEERVRRYEKFPLFMKVVP